MTPKSSDRLGAYREKRSASRTPEPFGVVAASAAVSSSGGRLFVVQKHAARSLHWDFRLESDGVLLSWAVPKGPSPNPADKRMAVHVEDHPLDYADFEGVIPEGEYGAGPVIVWDRGAWIPLEDEHAGMTKGKLLFELRGYKLRGRWTLVKTKQSEKSWLLIKERDGFVREEGTESYPDDSIYSGLEVEELPDVGERTAELLRKIAELGGKEVTRTRGNGGKEGRGNAGETAGRKQGMDPREVEIMLATSRRKPFSAEGWVFEIKYDGYRMIAGRDESRGGEAVLVSRSGGDFTSTFPEVARAVRGLPYEGLVLDGEVVVHDERGLPSFDRLQRRGLLQRRADIARAVMDLPATYYAFDLLAFGDYDLRDLPLLRRKELLREILPTVGPIRFSDHIEELGVEMYEEICSMGLEGVVAKKADAPYRGGRRTEWLKIRALTTDDFVIVGWTEPQGSRTGFGALHLAQFAPEPEGELVYVGSVGTGFDDAMLGELHARLEKLERDEPAFVGEDPNGRWRGGSGRDGGGPRGERGSAGGRAAPEDGRKRAHHWAVPELVCEVRYREFTERGLLRHALFVRLREDKRPEECVLGAGNREADAGRAETATGHGREGSPGAGGASAPEAAARTAGAPPDGDASHDVGAPGGEVAPGPEATMAIEPAPRKEVPFTNLDKVFWPEAGYTKGDLIEYYRSVSGWLLPYLRDRPLVLTRYPDGIEGKSFFQKNAPEWAPDWIDTVKLWSEDSERDIEYFVVNDLESLLYVVNLGTIPLHVWSSRVSNLGQPDWCILDLDPKEAPFEDVVAIARHIRKLCEEIDLPVFPKTSGSTGLHVLIPLGRRCTHEHSRTLAELLARIVAAELPEIATIVRSPGKRGGRVYVDWVQNGHGRLLVAPFSVRPVPEASVSAPLRWTQVTRKLHARAHTMRNLPARMRRAGADPMAPVLELKPDLVSALGRLSERLERGPFSG